MESNNPSRRDFLNILIGSAGALAAFELSFVGLRFFAPRVAEGEFGSTFNLGSAEQYPPGSVTPFESGRFYLVRLEDGGLLALYYRCSHLGCTVPYEQETGQFVCPCHGSAFSRDGDVLNEPAPRPLDMFSLTINETGEIEVDTSNPIQRSHASPGDLVFA
jgi:cytochrome b6-f complex iron-sulfur subunit